MEGRYPHAYSAACHAKQVLQEKLEARSAIADDKMALTQEHREQMEELQDLQKQQRSYQVEASGDLLDMLRRHIRNEHEREQLVQQGHESRRNGSLLLEDMRKMLEELSDAWYGPRISPQRIATGRRHGSRSPRRQQQ